VDSRQGDWFHIRERRLGDQQHRCHQRWEETAIGRTRHGCHGTVVGGVGPAPGALGQLARGAGDCAPPQLGTPHKIRWPG
jgi:hypothetical protein